MLFRDACNVAQATDAQHAHNWKQDHSHKQEWNSAYLTVRLVHNLCQESILEAVEQVEMPAAPARSSQSKFVCIKPNSVP